MNLEGRGGAQRLWDGFTAAHRKLASLFRQMDGAQDDGPLYEYLGRTMNERSRSSSSTTSRRAIARAPASRRPLTRSTGPRGDIIGHAVAMSSR